ncbi:DUF488 domain-containing protein [bacterium]|nr:DUF488 domain-containing protein [bacterium]
MLYNRQKFLMTFLDIFGGGLSRTNCQKLVFLFSEYNNKGYYDFFPYKFGPFSHVLYDDKRALIKKKILDDVESFVLLEDQINKVKDFNIEDRMLITQFKDEVEGVRGKSLIEKTYDEFPYFAKNSELLSHGDSIQIGNDENNPRLYSIGYEGISIDKYLNTLIYNEIEILFDVRNNPISRKYGFSKNKLKQYTNAVNIEYYHIPELGIPSKYRKDENVNNDINELFDFYKKKILKSSMNKVDLIKEKLLRNKSIALTCFEADYRLCHRQYICRSITESTGIQANHI